MTKRYTITFVTILVFSVVAVSLSCILPIPSKALLQKAVAFIGPNTEPVKRMGAPMTTSGDNLYIV
jgi:hypothetical protein